MKIPFAIQSSATEKLVIVNASGLSLSVGEIVDVKISGRPVYNTKYELCVAINTGRLTNILELLIGTGTVNTIPKERLHCCPPCEPRKLKLIFDDGSRYCQVFDDATSVESFSYEDIADGEVDIVELKFLIDIGRIEEMPTGRYRK